jgi:putative membrane protein
LSEAGAPVPATPGLRLDPRGLAVHFVAGLPQLFVPIIALSFGTRSSNLGAGYAVLTVLAISLLFRWLAWTRFRYFIEADDIRIERGLLSRSARSIPYDRIQDVSVEQKPLARLLGVGEVKFETGGGVGEEAKLSFVSLAEAQRLRETVRTRKASAVVPGAEEAAADDTPEAPPVYAMDNRRLVTLGFYSFSLVIFAVLAGAAQQFDFLLPWGWDDLELLAGEAEKRGVDLVHVSFAAQLGGVLIGVLSLVAIGIGTGVVRTFLTQYGFRLDRTAKGFRRRRGLLTRTDVVMPVERVQAIAVTTGPVRRRNGWYALHFVSLASDTKQQADHEVAPLARLDEIWPIAAEAGVARPADNLAFTPARPGPWIDRWLLWTLFIALIAAANMLAGLSVAGWLMILSLPLAIGAWLSWRTHAAALDERQVYVRHGWWKQVLGIARQVNVQSVSIVQGPLMRRRGLADVEFGIAGGKLAIRSVPLETARALREQVLALVTPVDFSKLGQASR